jgi:uncharacterized membrane protein YfcA
MVLILRFLPIVLLIVAVLLLARQTLFQKETAEDKPERKLPMPIVLSGIVGLFVLFVGAAEFITRM